jgi:glycosyltransferase involved in cell wall biosynthesis
MLAQQRGNFPRKFIRSWAISLSKHHDQGLETPFSLTVSPTLPLALWAMRPAVVISNNLNVWTLLTLIMGFPTVLFWEGTPHTERTVKPWREALRRWMVKRVSTFVVNGRLSRQYLEHLGAPPNLIIEGGLGPAAPPASLSREGRSVDPGQLIRFIFIGRLIPLKGADILLRATAELKSRLTPEDRIEILIIGDGPERERLSSEPIELGLANLVTFGGSLAPEAVWAQYERSHVFVLPTLQDNWPLVAMEAMAAGLPILLSKGAGSVPDIVEEGGNGWSFDPNDIMALADHMAAYVRRPELVLVHGQRSQKLVARYMPEEVAGRFLKAVELAENPSGAPDNGK